MSFRNVFGHEKQIEMLQKNLSQGRISHAYLFSGIPAVGKRTLALEFAKAVNCQKADTLLDACGQCISCRKIEHGSHPDYFSVEADGQFIRIDAVRQIQEQMKFKPLEAKYRIFIIDNADRMNEQAANALLKTLEEPSTVNLIMLITNRPYSLPETIISRCRHIRFKPLSNDIVARFLSGRPGIQDQKASLLASLSGGSIGRALALNDEEAIACREKTLEVLSGAQNSAPFSLIALASFLAQNKAEIRTGLDIIASCFRDALVLKETGKTQALINQDKSSLIRALSARLSGEKILRNIRLVEKAEETIEQNGNKSLTLETMAFKLNY